jgi:methionyl-tRNA formyltransferase
MGTPDFAVAALDAVTAVGHDVVCVYTQPPRPAGRGKKLRPSPVQKRAEKLGIEVRSPVSLKDAAALAAFADLDADIAVVAAYGLILPKAVLEAPRLGCVNIHASLLPRWRGAAPIQRAILAGDEETGVTIMQMDEGLDTGAMLTARAIPIGDDDAGALHDRLAALGGEMIVEALDRLAADATTPIPQPDEGVTYAAKLTREEEAIDWSRSADEIVRQIRAFAPRPGAYFTLNNEKWKVLDGSVAGRVGVFGTVLDDRLCVAAGTGSVAMERVQRPGRKPMAVDDVLRGHPVPAGTVLG